MPKAIRRIIAASLLCFSMWAQPKGDAPTFDVASVKPNHSGEGTAITHNMGADVQMRNVPLRAYILMAYDIPDYQLQAPDWVRSERYDIAAKAAPDTPHEIISRMMQALLAERFQLTVHRESKTLSAYVLVVGKNGPKLKESKADSPKGGTSKTHLSAQKATMAKLAEMLGRVLGGPVADRTGLTGFYDAELTWTPDDGKNADSSGPSIFTAIQEQLGLKLETSKFTADVLVVDRANKIPTEN